MIPVLYSDPNLHLEIYEVNKYICSQSPDKIINKSHISPCLFFVSMDMPDYYLPPGIENSAGGIGLVVVPHCLAAPLPA